jgi:hypothetical protein
MITVSQWEEFVALGVRCNPLEVALRVAVEIAEAFSLQAVGDDAVEKMPGQVIGGLAAEHRPPPCSQAGEVEIAHARDLVLQFAR